MKFLLECEKDHIQWTRVKTRSQSLIVLKKRLYCIDDKIMIRDRGSSKAIAIYDINNSQPRTCDGVYIDPDMTRALIVQGKIANNHKGTVSSLGNWSIEKILTVLIVGGGAIYWILMQLGL